METSVIEKQHRHNRFMVEHSSRPRQTREGGGEKFRRKVRNFNIRHAPNITRNSPAPSSKMAV